MKKELAEKIEAFTASEWEEFISLASQLLCQLTC